LSQEESLNVITVKLKVGFVTIVDKGLIQTQNSGVLSVRSLSVKTVEVVSVESSLEKPLFCIVTTVKKISS
jgi:hypothetical protein